MMCCGFFVFKQKTAYEMRISDGSSDVGASDLFVECTSGCPASTVTNRTINDNHIAGAFYLDTSLTFDVEMAGKELELYLAVNNLLNKDPAVVAPGPAGSAYATPATNQSLYDLLGRTYRVSIRFKL